MDISEIRKAILLYLSNHPNAGDTLEGISSWWIRESLVQMKVEEVSRCVSQLVSEGILRERALEKAGVVYFLNKEKLDAIRNALKP